MNNERRAAVKGATKDEQSDSRAAVGTLSPAQLALTSAALLLRFRVNSMWLVLGGALTGCGLASFGK
jgi:hypothetical protein